MKNKHAHLSDVLAKELRSEEFKMAFDQSRFYLQIAHLISDLRAKTGLSQAELAKRAGVSQPMVARLEKGDRRRTPTFETINKVVRALGYTISVDIRRSRKSRVA